MELAFPGHRPSLPMVRIKCLPIGMGGPHMGWTVMAGGDSMCEGGSARCKHRSMTEKNG